jgi:predicted aspartyl protease
MLGQRTFLAASLAIVLATTGWAAAAAPKCTMERIEEWPLRPAPNRVIVEGAINGRSVGIMLDTGAMRSLVVHSAAVRLELPRRDLKGVRMFGIGGETRVEVALIDEFRIGQTSRKDLRLLVGGEHDFDDGVDVVLGEDFLHVMDVEFDLKQRAVRLFQPKDCDGASLAYWAGEAPGEVEIEPLSERRPEIVLTVRVNGQATRAKLDSGASSSVLSTLDAAAAGVTPETPGVVAAGKSGGFGANTVDNWIGPFQSFAIGNETIRDTRIRFADLYKDTKYTATGSHVSKNVEPLHPMLLGVDFLGAHRVLVAHSQRKLYFTYLGGPVFQTHSVTSVGSPQEAGAPPATADRK